MGASPHLTLWSYMPALLSRRLNIRVVEYALISCALLALAAVYVGTLQTHISGSFQETTPDQVLKNEYIKDVAEIQVALNVWGTIHHTATVVCDPGNLVRSAPR
jgi:Flp pilus assembly pilin Flp